MSGFSKEWLALRESADARARDSALLAELRFAPDHGFSIVDLGAGTGSNLRYLAPRLGGEQHWTLVDSDAALLSAAEAPSAPSSLAVETLQRDLAHSPEDLPLEGCALVTASAFFDLVSEDWLERFARNCAAARVANGLFALNVDGTIIWTPSDPDDADIECMFNAHMRRDKGFGPALGAKAPERIARAFESAGYGVSMGESPWRLSPDDAVIQDRLLQGYVDAACEQFPDDAEKIQDWAARRAIHLAQGESALFVGHRDVLVRLV